MDGGNPVEEDEELKVPPDSVDELVNEDGIAGRNVDVDVDGDVDDEKQLPEGAVGGLALAVAGTGTGTGVTERRLPVSPVGSQASL